MPKYKFSDIAINSTAKKKPVEEDKYTYIGLEHLDSGTLTVSRWGADVAPIGEKLIMKKGDVLFGKRRAYQKKVGIAPFDGIFSAHGMVLRPKEKVITKEYFPLFISSDYFLDKAIQISVGSLSPTINWKDLKNLEFEIPPIEEQLRVAPVIWAAIDTKNAYNKLLQETDELIKSQFIEMFNADSPQSCNATLSKYAEVFGGYAFKSKEFQNNGIPIIRISDIDGEKVNTENAVCYPEQFWNDYPSYRVMRNDVLMAMSGATTGKTGLIQFDAKALLNQRVACIRSKYEEYVYFILTGLHLNWMNELILQSSPGSAQPNISGKQIEELPFPYAEKDKIALFSMMAEQSDKSKFELKKAIEGVDNLIRSLVQQELK